MEFFNSIRDVKRNWQPYKKWEAEQNDKEAQRQELHKRVPASKRELAEASQYGRVLIDSVNVMDQCSINKAEDVEMTFESLNSVLTTGLELAGLGAYFFSQKIPAVKKYLDKLPANSMKKISLLFIAPMILPLMAMPFISVASASCEKEASRIARYQAREQELKDPKSFVVYNKQQMDEAKKIASTLPDPVEKKKKGFSSYKESMKSLLDDHQKYLNWKKENSKNEKTKKESFATMNPTPDQLLQAKKDQDSLLRVIKKIELSSQQYLSNVEMACNMVFAGNLLLGAVGGAIISKLLQMLKVISPASKSANTIKDAMPIAVPFVLEIATIIYSTKIQKEAARIGRFKAKQDLLNNPYNFITYTNEQEDSVKNIKAPSKPKKGIFKNLKDNIKFFFQLGKDYKEYENYKKNDYKKDEKLRTALKKVNITTEQLKDGKALQKNAFMSFEKMDEMTQRYVDDTEAATDIFKRCFEGFLSIGGTLLSMYLLLKPSSAKDSLQKTLLKYLPMFAPLFVLIPVEMKTTHIKQQAGKIGTMKAMQDLEDTRNFVS